MNLIQSIARLPEQAQGAHFLLREITFRVALPVTQVVHYPGSTGCYPVCPRCKRSMEREYTSFCDRCGQRLSWDQMDDADVLIAPIRQREQEFAPTGRSPGCSAHGIR